jgi:hypothetical protein
MAPLRFSIFVIGLVAANLLSGCRTHPEKSCAWQPLFDGKTLSGWHVYLKDENTVVPDTNHLVQIHDGEIHMYKDAEAESRQPFGYIRTEKEFTSYHLRLEYKWGVKKFVPRAKVKRDSGLLYHCGEDTIWPVCVECQIQEGDAGDIYALSTRVTSTVDPATTNATPMFLESGISFEQTARANRIIRNPMNEHEGWNTMEIIVRGDSATYIVNGKINNRCSNIRQKIGDTWVPLTKGHIALQLEGAEISFRNVQIQESKD